MKTSAVIADMNEIFRQGLYSLMTSMGEFSSITQVDNGEDAWRMIQKVHPDIAILEVHLPKVSGLDVARKVGVSGLATQVIVLASFDDPLVAMVAQNMGVSGYIYRSCSGECWVLALKTIIAGGTFVTPEIRNRLRKLNSQGMNLTDLSPREREILRMIASGMSGKQIARTIDVSPRTVDTYRERVLKKIDGHNISDLVRFAIHAGIID